VIRIFTFLGEKWDEIQTKYLFSYKKYSLEYQGKEVECFSQKKNKQTIVFSDFSKKPWRNSKIETAYLSTFLVLVFFAKLWGKL